MVTYFISKISETSQRRVCWRSCHCFVSVQSAGLLPHCMLNHAVDTLLVSQSHYRLQYAMVGFYSYQADLACNSFFWKNVCSQFRCGSLAGTPSKELGKFLFHILKLQFNPFSYFHVFYFWFIFIFPCFRKNTQASTDIFDLSITFSQIYSLQNCKPH